MNKKKSKKTNRTSYLEDKSKINLILLDNAYLTIVYLHPKDFKQFKEQP